MYLQYFIQSYCEGGDGLSTKLYGNVIKVNANGDVEKPELVLAYRSGEKQGVITNAVSLVLNSKMNEADEIYVLDTGSTDDTVKKLAELGVNVKTKIITP